MSKTEQAQRIARLAVRDAYRNGSALTADSLWDAVAASTSDADSFNFRTVKTEARREARLMGVTVAF